MTTRGGLKIPITYILKDAAMKRAERGMKNLGRSAGDLTRQLTKFATVAGIAEFARQSVVAASEMEKSTAKLTTSLNAIGASSKFGGKEIQKTTKDMQNLGFQGQQSNEALANLVTITGSLTKAQGLMGKSADAARFLHQDLATAATMLGKATIGSAKGFQAFGITLDKTLPSAQAFDKAMSELNARIGGEAQAYANTYAGRLEILTSKFDDIKIMVGEKLLPKLLELTEWFDKKGIPKIESFFKFLGNNIEGLSAFATAIGVITIALKALTIAAGLADLALAPLLIAAAPFLLALGGIAGITALIATSPVRKTMTASQKSSALGGGGYAQGGAAAFASQNYGKNTPEKIAARKKTAAAVPTPGAGLDPFAGFNKIAYGMQLAAKTEAAAAKKRADLERATAAKKLSDQRKSDAAKALQARKDAADKKLSAQFDLTQIALANALKNKLTATEKAAVEGLMALQDDGYKTEEQRMKDQEAALAKLIALKKTYAEQPWSSTATDIGTGMGGTSRGENLGTGTIVPTSAGAGASVIAAADPFLPPPAKNGGQAKAPVLIFNPPATSDAAMSASNAATNTNVSNMPGWAEAEAAATAAMAAMSGGNAAAPSSVVVNVQGSVMTENAVTDAVFNALNKVLRNGGSFYQNAATG